LADWLTSVPCSDCALNLLAERRALASGRVKDGAKRHRYAARPRASSLTRPAAGAAFHQEDQGEVWPVREIAWIGGLVVAFACQPSVAATTLSDVPEEFRGVWVVRPASCGRSGGRNDLAIRARRIEMEQGDGEIVSVVLVRPRVVNLTIRLQGNGAGEGKVMTARFELTADGRALFERSPHGRLNLRRRCP